MNSEFEYYFMQRRGDRAYPLIRIVENERDERGYTRLMHLEFNTPVPQNPVLADFLSGPEVFLTKRIVDVIREFEVEGVRLIPTELTDTRGNTSEDYYAVVPGNHNYYEALDKENSEFQYKRGSYWINKLILDKKVLGGIPIERRLICGLAELPGKTLFHQSLVDAIMKLEPTGVSFRNIEEYEL